MTPEMKRHDTVALDIVYIQILQCLRLVQKNMCKNIHSMPPVCVVYNYKNKIYKMLIDKEWFAILIEHNSVRNYVIKISFHKDEIEKTEPAYN